jgi:hypothetical protein
MGVLARLGNSGICDIHGNYGMAVAENARAFHDPTDIWV